MMGRWPHLLCGAPDDEEEDEDDATSYSSHDHRTPAGED
jgi:hypothetical protein